MQKYPPFRINIYGEHFIGRNCLIKRLFENQFNHQFPFVDHYGCEFHMYPKLIDRQLTNINIMSFYCGRKVYFESRLFLISILHNI